VRYADSVRVQLNAAVQMHNGVAQLVPNHPTTLLGIPYDRPVIGYGGKMINSLRLWEASSPEFFDFGEFSHGDFFGSVHDKVMAENLTRVLYPDDSTPAGKRLRFGQEYFLVACSPAGIIARFRRSNTDWHALPDKVAIQLNDTHPSVAVAELMRILLDEAHLGWDTAWNLTVRMLAYTNHTLLPEALEKWTVEAFERVLPRHLEIIYEINRRFLDGVRARYRGDQGRVLEVTHIGLKNHQAARRLDERMHLGARMDQLRQTWEQAERLHAFDSFQSQAWHMVTGPQARRAFDLSLEDTKLRDRYGRNTWGQRCLLARRLVEAGVDLVTATLNGPICERTQSWDDHAVNHHVFEAMKNRAPYFDQAVTALIEDIYQRGLDQRVLVIVGGDFGRTPRISYAADSASGVRQPGRDHWPHAMSFLFSASTNASSSASGSERLT
jgi:hypothetical protein